MRSTHIYGKNIICINSHQGNSDLSGKTNLFKIGKKFFIWFNNSSLGMPLPAYALVSMTEYCHLTHAITKHIMRGIYFVNKKNYNGSCFNFIEKYTEGKDVSILLRMQRVKFYPNAFSMVLTGKASNVDVQKLIYCIKIFDFILQTRLPLNKNHDRID